MGAEDLAGSRPKNGGWVWVGLALIAAYALPLLAPPGPAPPGPSDAALLARLFPGVPGGWVVLRLACLAAGAALLAWCARSEPSLRLEDPIPPARVQTGLALAALGVALALVAAAMFVGSFSGPGQLVFVLALGLPAALLAGASASPSPRLGPPPAALVAVLAVAGLWLAIRLPSAWHDPRAATLVDLWYSFWWLEDAVRDGANALVEGGQPGIANGYMLLLGLPFLQSGGLTLELASVQTIHSLWLVATALLLAGLVSRLVSASAGVFAASAFLFSPFVLMLTLCPSPFGIFTACAAALLLLLHGFHRTGSPASLAALAAVAGFSTTSAYLVNVVGLAGGVTAVLLLVRRPRPLWLYWGIPALVFLAAALPALPDPSSVVEMRALYVERSAPWTPLEAILTGQRSPVEPPGIPEIWQAGRSRPVDVALGAIASPFATPRTAVRLWSDSLLEPLSAALGAVGILLCVLGWRRAGARALLLLFAVTVVPAALTSAYDRASLLRNLSMPLAMALLGAVGFDALRRRLLPGARLLPAVVASVVVAASGLWLSDRVNPRVLAASWVAISLEAARAAPPAGGARLLDHEIYTAAAGGMGWNARLAGRYLPETPIPAKGYGHPRDLLGATGQALAEVVFWSPALEHDAEVGRGVCDTWPQAALFVLVDGSGQSRAHAARRGGSSWEPALPAERWSQRECP